MERNTEWRNGQSVAVDLAAGAKTFLGTLVVLDAGYAKAGFADPAVVCVGIAKTTVDNTDGADGDVKVVAEKGTYKLDNATVGDAITRVDIGKPCFVLDATTVAKTDGGAARAQAGIVFAVDGNSVWVTI
ncbi:hypothetical protein JI58_00270 [Marinosulfonomonas sp. PRT-SC04]|nr:hypothetical protein JI58_00270 [Marinosulfonomonas sp. PRT-SC04]